MRLRIAALALSTTLGLGIATASAQTAAEHVAAGDRAHAALDITTALREYEAAVTADSTNYDALIKAAHDAVDLGEFNPSADARTALYRRAEHYARLAVAANPNEAAGHFELARAVGRNALTMGSRDRVKFAGVVRDEALKTLAIDPKHAGALHVMGLWNAEVMRLNGLARLVAKTFLGGSVFGEASWDNAQRYLEQAVALDSTRITHRLDLGAVYEDRGDRAKAIALYEWIARAPVTDFNDPKYKELAAARLSKLR
jgi:tetratricopeptide (TPR) repeat protein